jgi:hypothetical protein
VFSNYGLIKNDPVQLFYDVFDRKDLSGALKPEYLDKIEKFKKTLG